MGDNKTKMKTLDQIMLGIRSDKASLYHNYTPVYEHYFEPFRNDKFVFLELGLGDKTSLNREGEDLLAFQEYLFFHPSGLEFVLVHPLLLKDLCFHLIFWQLCDNYQVIFKASHNVKGNALFANHGRRVAHARFI